MGNNYITPVAQEPQVSGSETGFVGLPSGCCLAGVKIASPMPKWLIKRTKKRVAF